MFPIREKYTRFCPKLGNIMKLAELIETAARARKNQSGLAKELNVTTSRISEWKSGERQPTTGQVGLMAEIAGLPALETIAAVESAQNSDFAGLWGRIVGKMKAAGVTAAITIISAVSLTMIPAPSQAAGGNGRLRH